MPPAGVTLARVYPRVCGGSSVALPRPCQRYGLSPRVRGKPPTDAPGHPRRRSIPACAGEAYRRRQKRHWRPVYPRVCGGSSRRRRPSATPAGLSPRVRGKHGGNRSRSKGAGSIPACAGEALQSAPGQPARRVYPRVCGGSLKAPGHWPGAAGLSPRVRGKPGPSAARRRSSRSIPACAGEADAGRV